jgi:heparan-sulfate lyase
VHQTLTLDGKNSAYAPQLLQWSPGKENDVLVVENKSYSDLTHRRAVFFVDKRYFVLVDEAYGSAAGQIDLHFQLAPGKASFHDEQKNVTTDFGPGWNLSVQTQDQEGLLLVEEEGQVSFLYTQKEPRPAFCYRLQKTAGQPFVRYITLVVPYKTTQPPLKIFPGKESDPITGKYSFEVEEYGQRKKLGYSF